MDIQYCLRYTGFSKLLFSICSPRKQTKTYKNNVNMIERDSKINENYIGSGKPTYVKVLVFKNVYKIISFVVACLCFEVAN